MNYQSRTELHQGVNVREKACRKLERKYHETCKTCPLLGTLKSDCLRQVVVLLKTC